MLHRRLARAISTMLGVTLAACVITSCVTVTVVDRQGQKVDVKRSVGAIRIGLAPSADALVAQSKGIGLINSPLGLSLGYSRQTIAALPASCRIVAWIDRTEQAEALARLTTGRPDSCVLPNEMNRPEQRQ
jgi:hypothetical protein